MKKEVEVTTPMAPSFIRVGKEFIGIELFTDKELKEIAKEWTINLLAKAGRRRNGKIV